MPRRFRPSAKRTPRRVAILVASTAMVCAVTMVAVSVLATSASSRARTPQPTRAQVERAAVRTSAQSRVVASAERAPRADGLRCERSRAVPAQGRSCRSADGSYLLAPSSGGAARAAGAALATHGPDFVDPADVVARTRAARDAGPVPPGSGTGADIVCSSSNRSRHVVLVYLLPADFADAARGHGDRFTTVADQMRQSIQDASALIDRTAGQLAPGSHRRLRLLCDSDLRPVVIRHVLPRTAEEYAASSGGFAAIVDDLASAGLAPDYDDFTDRHLPAVRRLLAYYDADFVPGVAGQGTMYRRAALLQAHVSPTNPLVSRTSRNINNNPPQVSVAVQYGTRYDGVPDPPLSTSLLHELTHTMGAVQDEPATSSDAGHCSDGLDVMCYADGGPAEAYSDAVCPDPVPPAGPEDERYDCDGDTYFNPAPAAGSALADPRTWQLGLVANETFDPSPAGTGTVTQPTGAAATLPVASGLHVAGTGTSLTAGWSAPSAAAWELTARSDVGLPAAAPVTTRTSAAPELQPFTTYRFAVTSVSGAGAVGRSTAVVTRRTGADTTPPARPEAPRQTTALRGGARIAWSAVHDNVGVTRYRIERRSGSRWVLAKEQARTAGPTTTQAATVTGLGLHATTSVRVIALDRRGNRSVASLSARVVTRG